MEERPDQPGDWEFPDESEPQPPRQPAFLIRMLAWLPMAFFAACLVLALVAQPLTRALTPIPVTNGLPAAPTLTPRPPGSVPTDAPGLRGAPDAESAGRPYKELAAARIQECTIAFHEFYILERMAAHRPEMVDSDSWREDARVAMQDFETGCTPLGELPEAPRAYVEADRWLKLAAGEVDSASVGFTALMDASDAGQVEVIARHMMNFLEYTHNAEEIIRRLDERKEI